MRSWLPAVSAGLLAAACAGAPTPSSDAGLVWGTVRLQPPDGVAAHASTSASYGDRRYRDAVRVDYTRPGFVVVYAEAGESAGGLESISVVESRFGVRLLPKRAAVGLGGRIVVRNETSRAQVVSCPERGLLAELAPHEELAIEATHPGRHSVHLIGAPGETALAFVSPGPFTVVGDRGRFELGGLPVGPALIRTWHPRFPPTARQVQVSRGQVLRVDLDLAARAAAEMSREAD